MWVCGKVKTEIGDWLRAKRKEKLVDLIGLCLKFGCGGGGWVGLGAGYGWGGDLVVSAVHAWQGSKPAPALTV